MFHAVGLNHFVEEGVDEVLPVAEVASLDKVVRLLAPPARRGVELEGPQEVGGVLEVGSDGDDLVDEVLDANDAELAKLLLDDVVGRDGRSASVLLDKAPLVHQLADRLEGGRSPGDVGLANPQHVDGGLVQLDEDTVVDLSETEELESLLDLGSDLVDTTDADDKGILVLGGDVEVALLLGLAPQPDLLALLVPVLPGVLLGLLEDLHSLLLASDLVKQCVLGTGSLVGLLALAPLQDGLGDRRQLCVWHSPIFTNRRAKKPHVLCVAH